MTKYAGIIIRAAVDLQRIPEAEKDVARRFLFEYVQGLNRKHHKRWMRGGRTRSKTRSRGRAKS